MACEAICLVLDVGASASQQPPGGVSFLNSALECASMFLERKLYSETKDEIAIVLFGTEESNNPQDYDYVKILDRGFCRADWDTIKFLRHHVEGTRVEADWIDGLVVALDLLKRESDAKKFSALKIVLFSDLGCEANSEQKNIIIEGMRLLDNVDFTHIGPRQLVEHIDEESQKLYLESQDSINGDSDEFKDPKPGPSRRIDAEKSKNRHDNDDAEAPSKPLTDIQKENQKVASDIIEQTGGMMCSIEDAVAAFFYKSKKGRKPTAWKVIFEIGPDIRISTQGYIKVRREQPKSWKRTLDGGTEDIDELRPDYLYIRNNENQEIIEPEDLVFSYRYGDELVAITDADEAACKFEGGPKSLMLFGFVDRCEIKMSDLKGNGNMVFLPTEDDENSERALSALAEAMVEMNTVAIVRRVYNKSTNPVLGVLAPEEDAEGNRYLVYADLPFIEDRRDLQFPSLDDPKRPPSEDQLAAIDDLIDNLDLEATDEAGGSVSIINPEEELNPQYQYLYQALTERALNPGRPLPPVSDRLRSLLSIPEELSDRVDPVVERLRSVFPVEEVVKPTRKRKNEENQDNSASGEKKEEESGSKKHKAEEDSRLDLDEEDMVEHEAERVVYNIGTITPVDDFNYLLSNSVTTGANIESVGLQMEEVIEKFLSSAFGNDLNPKIISCFIAYRDACRDRGRTKQYNDFIRKVRDNIEKKMWMDLIKSPIGLLTFDEVDDGVTESEADRFARNVAEEEQDESDPEIDDDALLNML